jgi:hypothetical protein
MRLALNKMRRPKQGGGMLRIIAIILCLLWALGLLTSFTLGGGIHALPIIAGILLFIQIVKKRPNILFCEWSSRQSFRKYDSTDERISIDDPYERR